MQRSTLTNDQFKAELLACKNCLDAIVEKFIRPDSVREVNLPVHVRKPFLQLHDKGVHHPNLIDESISHIVNMLRLNTLTKFLKSASRLEGKLFNEMSDGNEKLTIKQIVLNFVPKPYSREDFMAFLKKEVRTTITLALRGMSRILGFCYRLSQVFFQVFSVWFTTRPIQHFT